MPPHRARVVLYSDTDSSDSLGDENLQPTQATCGTQPKKRKTERIAYEPWRKFESNAEFEGFWEEECANWISTWTASNREQQGSNCPIKLQIVQKRGTVTLEKSAGEHVGHNEEGGILTDEIKTKIKELLSDGRTPGQIRNKLQELGMQVPMLVQIGNLVSREKRKSGAHAPLTDLKLHQYCADNRDSNVMDPDDSYVLGYRYEKQDDKQHFIVMVGFSDASHKFHPVAIAVSSHEDKWMYRSLLTIVRENAYSPQVVFADGCASITNAVEAVYPEALRAICWAHAAKAIDRKLNSVPLEIRRILRGDINKLQLCTDLAQFERAGELMRENWNRLYGENEPVRGSFAVCVAKQRPRVEKELDMARKRVSFRTFVDVVEKAVQRWSSLPDYHEVKSRPIISPHTFFLAYQLKRDKRLQVHNDDGTWAYVASTENKAFSADDIATKVESIGRHDFDNWDAFLKLRFGVHIIELKDDWYRCSCSVGVKKVLCKHAVRLMCTKKLLSYPPDAMAEPVGSVASRNAVGPARVQVA